MALTQSVFLSNGNWVCPAGVTCVILLGMPGGSGGQGGRRDDSPIAGGKGGLGSVLMPAIVDVVPNTTYAVTIGAGGTGSAGVASAIPARPGDGGDTSFGALMVWVGMKCGRANFDTDNEVESSSIQTKRNTHSGTGTKNIALQAFNQEPGNTPNRGFAGSLGLSAAGGVNTSATCGGGGMSGEGIGGVGGNGSAGATVGGSGGSAAANTGAGGGGGGHSASGTGGVGGNGGSGKLVVIWAE